jgi:hypothetical protein
MRLLKTKLTDKIMENLVIKYDDAAEIPTEHLSNTSVLPERYTNSSSFTCFIFVRILFSKLLFPKV